jgi:hypothetical protein
MRFRERFGSFFGKRGLVWQTLIPWIIVLVVLVLILIIYSTINDKGTGAIEYFKNLWRFSK